MTAALMLLKFLSRHRPVEPGDPVIADILAARLGRHDPISI